MAFRRALPEENRPSENIFISITDLTISILLVVMILLAFVGSNLRDTRALSKIGDLEENILSLKTEKNVLTDQLQTTQNALNIIQVATQKAIREAESKTILNNNLEKKLV
ncbi:hypothetical protein N9C56_16180, partial [Paracoccaceae bacterium]|nr:hypothetical protein [Paracoccaceae bacterium]